MRVMIVFFSQFGNEEQGGKIFEHPEMTDDLNPGKKTQST